MHSKNYSYGDIHTYALNINSELERLRINHRTNEVRIIFDSKGNFSGFKLNGKEIVKRP